MFDPFRPGPDGVCSRPPGGEACEKVDGPADPLSARALPVTADRTGAAEEGRQGFAAFVARYARGLDRLAYLMLGDEHAAEDLAADALLAAWQHWDRVRQADHPLAYVRRILVNQASGHFRRQAREVTMLGRLKLMANHDTHDPDTAVVVDVRAALMRLPPRRRACLVLRHCFQLTEYEVAETLGVSVGTVKSQTSKAAAQFRLQLGDAASAVADALQAETRAAERQRRGSHAG
jgi:RNA polymerase sigma-70 factor (sigma-E family)